MQKATGNNDWKKAEEVEYALISKQAIRIRKQKGNRLAESRTIRR